jgi:hypothetical protein
MHFRVDIWLNSWILKLQEVEAAIASSGLAGHASQAFNERHIDYLA